jgi:SMODS-associating 2TM, beta-strand rich effector domain
MEHPYSINLRERQVVYFVLAIISFGASLLIGKTFALLRWAPPSWLDIPGAFTIFGLLSWWFDKRIWRWPLIRWMGLATPILDGQWSGTTRSSFDSFRKEHPVRVTIRQSWTTMSVALAAGRSNSHSTTAAISMGSDPLLVYSFTNEPEVGATDTMHIHIGTAVLRILRDELVGEYYSGRDRQNIGKIELRRATG